MRIHHDDRPALGVVLLHRPPERFLREVLHLSIEGRDERPAGDRRLHDLHAARDRQAVAVQLHRAGPGRTGEDALVLELETRETRGVDPDEPQHLRRERAGRVVALRDLQEADARQPECFEAIGDMHIDLSAEVDEGGIGRPEPPLDVSGTQAQDARDLRRLADRVGHVAWVRVDVPRLQRDRQGHSGAIDDRASFRREIGRVHPLLEPLRGECSVVTHLQDHQPGDHTHQRQHHRAQQGDEATCGRALHSLTSPRGDALEPDMRGT